MSTVFVRTLYAGWGDLDANGHMRNTAYLDKSADLRMMFFAEHGFPVSEFQRLRAPPPELLAVMDSLPKTEDFEVMPSSIKKAG
jgi:acyl-CoA thioesterase FadM